MRNIQYGCQSYPWKMSIEKYAGNVPHMLDVTQKAGFQGFEAEICMLGEWFDRPEAFAEELDQRGLQFSTLVLHQDWEHPAETAEECALTEKAIAFVRRFRGAKIMVSHHAGTTPRGEGAQLAQRRENLIACMSSVANRAAEAGIVTAYHPNSAQNSLFRTPEDYQVLFEMLEKTDIGWAPDVGHIVNGGCDVMQTLRDGRRKIRHVHFKDRVGPNRWTLMGEGSIDYDAIVKYLKETGYGGWIVVEDEGPTAETDPDRSILIDGAYMQRYMK